MQRFQNILGQCGFNTFVNGSFSIVKTQVGNPFISILVLQFFCQNLRSFTCHPHCPKNNLKSCMKTEPLTVGAEATVYVWFLSQIFVKKPRRIPLHLLQP